MSSTHRLADVLRELKTVSSGLVHNEIGMRGFAWQEGYGAFSVSKSEEKKVIKYILDQHHHHAKRTFKDEFPEFLNRYEIEYDERYLWD